MPKELNRHSSDSSVNECSDYIGWMTYRKRVHSVTVQRIRISGGIRSFPIRLQLYVVLLTASGRPLEPKRNISGDDVFSPCSKHLARVMKCVELFF